MREGGIIRASLAEKTGNKSEVGGPLSRPSEVIARFCPVKYCTYLGPSNVSIAKVLYLHRTLQCQSCRAVREGRKSQGVDAMLCTFLGQTHGKSRRNCFHAAEKQRPSSVPALKPLKP